MRSKVKWCVVLSSFHFWRHVARVHKEFHHIQMTLLAGSMEWSEPVAVPAVRVACSFNSEILHYLQVTTESSVVEWSAVVITHLLWVTVTGVDKVLENFQVPTLTGSMSGGMA